MAVTNGDDGLRTYLLSKIDGSEREKYWTKVKVLMGSFGYQASTRVRQTSLNEVLSALDDWGIAYEYAGLGANDFVTLSRRASTKPSKKKSISVPPPSPTEPWLATLNPLHFAFHIGNERDAVRSRTHADDALAAIWSYRPICLLACADDESFATLGGLVSAVMRRRALMVRNSQFADRIPTAPELLTIAQLKKIVGRTDDVSESGVFPVFGSVYIVRDDPKDNQDDELVALVRELFIPTTYRADARFGTTDETRPTSRATTSDDFRLLLEWLCAFAGGRSLAGALGATDTLDLAALLADAAQQREVLLDRAVLRGVDKRFKAGFETTEHMALKNVLLQHLATVFPNDDIKVEQVTDVPDDERYLGEDESREESTSSKRRICRPDIWIPKKLWIEVETLRSISLRGSNPFFDLERKMRARLDEIRRDQSEVWLIVPSDVAALASREMAATARNLDLPKLRWGFVDLVAGAPVFVEVPISPSPPPPMLNGGSWREKAKIQESERLTWKDVAGYSSFQERLQKDVLLPLVEPERFEQHDLGPANGLLLFGLPGCGKSLVGRVLAGEADLTCRMIVPSDVTSEWLGQGVLKVRELFDWALKQRSCLLVVDEIDAIAPQRSESNMHSDEKRQVNELLAQLDRISGKRVMVVATTNYLRGVDGAVRRSGRFDVKIPVYPPNEADRLAVFEHYFVKLKNIRVDVDCAALASASALFTPADIKTVVHTVARRAVVESASPVVDMDRVMDVLRRHPRAIQRNAAEAWIAEARMELGIGEADHLDWLESEVRLAYPE